MFSALLKTALSKNKITVLEIKIYLIRWNENSDQFHGHNGKNCNFIIFNGNLNEYIYENKNIN